MRIHLRLDVKNDVISNSLFGQNDLIMPYNQFNDHYIHPVNVTLFLRINVNEMQNVFTDS